MCLCVFSYGANIYALLNFKNPHFIRLWQWLIAELEKAERNNEKVRPADEGASGLGVPSGYVPLCFVTWVSNIWHRICGFTYLALIPYRRNGCEFVYQDSKSILLLQKTLAKHMCVL